MKINIIESDVLIVGSGSAGLWAAHRFSEVSPESKICIVDKGPQDWGGLMAMAGGDFEAVLPGDTVDGWLEDLVNYFDGLCDQPYFEKILEQSAARFDDYQRFGCEFFHKPDGNLKSVPQRGLPHVKLYPVKLKGRGGELMVKSLVTRMKDIKAQRIGRVMLTKYLVKDNRVYGAVGFNCRTGDFYVFKTPAIIAATGMGGWKTSYGKNTPTGEGMKMAFEVGCQLQDLEFARVWNMPKLFAWEGQTHLFPLGARFVNRLGENFMSKYSPVLGPNTDPHFTTIGMALEVSAGRGPIIFDVSPLKDEDMILLKPQTGWQKINYDKLCKMGLDLFKDNTEWVPQMTVSHGGIRAGMDGSTAVEGLFAAGTARSLEPGVYAGGMALMSTSVTGYMVGEAAAKWLKSARKETSSLPDSEIDKLAAETFAPMSRKKSGALTPKEVLTRIQTVVFPYNVSIIKDGPALEKALAEIRRIKEEDLPAMTADDPHYLLKLKEVEAICFVSELFVHASLLRKESRAGHYRRDYPQLGANGPAWQYIKNNNGKPEFFFEAVPLDKYRIPLTRCYQNNFNFTA